MQRGLLLSLGTAVSLAVIGYADAAPPNSGQAWRSGKAALELAQPWLLRCNPPFKEMDADPELAGRLAARRWAGGIDVQIYDAGSGRWAFAQGTTWRLEHEGCATTGYSVEGGKESIIGGLRLLAMGGRAQPSLVEVAARREAVVADAGRADLAAARMAIQLASELRMDSEENNTKPQPALVQQVLGPPLPVQPEYSGRPHGSPSTLWTHTEAVAAGVKSPRTQNENGERFDAIVVYPIRPPELLLRKGSYELWEVRFRARLGGGLLAVYNRATGKHRWIFAERMDNSDVIEAGGRVVEFDFIKHSHFDVLSLDGDLLLLHIANDNYHSLYVINLRSGIARAVNEGGEVTFQRVPGGVSIRPLETETNSEPPHIIPLDKLQP